MKNSVKAVLLGVAVLVLVAGAFWGGTVLGGSSDTTGVTATGGQEMRGGPFADLSDAERAELESMSDEERQAWLQENMGSRPNGAQGGPTRGGTLQGEVIEATDDSITISLESGSQTVYLDSATVIAYVEGAGELGAGANVLVIAGPTGDPTASGSTTADIATASVVVVM